MYELSVQRPLHAGHVILSPDAGPEGEPHSHDYTLEVIVRRAELDQYGYVIDLLALEADIGEISARYENAHLNDLPEFAGINPSIEHFARVISESLAPLARAQRLQSLTVRIWEGPRAWASYTANFE